MVIRKKIPPLLPKRARLHVSKLILKRKLRKFYALAKSWYRDQNAPADGHIWLSLIVPTYNSQVRHLKALYASILEQRIEGVEIIFSDDASSDQQTLQWLKHVANQDKCQVIFNSENKGISGASNAAIRQARGKWIAFLDHDDLLAPWALRALYATLCSQPDVKFVYTDEVVVDDNLKLEGIFLKPAFDPILLSGVNYINHLCVYRCSRVIDLGLLNPDFDGSQDYDLVLRYTADLTDEEILHFPYPAYWWRRTEQSYSRAYLQKALNNAQRSLALHYDMPEYSISLSQALNPELHKIEFEPENGQWPHVGIIIPSRNAPELISRILPDLFERTDYPNFDVLVVDNGSDDPETLAYYESCKEKWPNLRISVRKEAFNFSRSINRGLEEISADHYLLLNNDVAVKDPDWLKEMVSCLAYRDVGIVGAKLLYADDTLQHAGVTVGQNDLAAHRYYKRPHDAPGDMCRLQVRNGMCCITGAVMLISSDCLEAVGAWDEENFAIAYNDVDYCMRAYKAGFRIVWSPFACLYHDESQTRGKDTTPENRERFEKEKANLKRLHGTASFIDATSSPLASRLRFAPTLDKTFSKPKARHWFEKQ